MNIRRWNCLSRRLIAACRLLVVFSALVFAGILSGQGAAPANPHDPVFLSRFSEVEPPFIISTPSVSVDFGASYSYLVEAADPNDLPVTFTLVQAPEGMTIGAFSGQISWSADVAGVHEIEVLAQNVRGAYGGQVFDLTVEDALPPTINSEPVTEINLDELYNYQPSVEDPNGLDLVFSLVEGPAGMSIDTASGLLEWPVDQEGDHAVEWGVQNSAGASASQSFTLTVVPPLVKFDIGGEVTGLEGGTLVLAEEMTGQTIAVEADGPYQFEIEDGTSYSIVVDSHPSQPTQTCVVDGGSGSVAGQDVDDIAAQCLPGPADVVTVIEDARDELDSGGPPTTADELDASEYGQNRMADAAQRRRVRDHALVMSAIDPDPAWFQTKLDANIVIAEPGSSRTVRAVKVDRNQAELGPVDSGLLKFSVRIQGPDGSFEWIPSEFAGDLVRWSEQPGEFEVTVPDDLMQGRLLVGLRPDFPNPGQRAIAERWATALVVEVWPRKANVRSIDLADVRFPVADDSPIHEDSEFSRLEIGAAMMQALDAGDIRLPIVVSLDSPLELNELVDYRFEGRIYGGRVASLQVRNGQQLALLAPEWRDVYEITEAEDGFLVDEGVLPENVIYRVGGPVDGFDAPYSSDLLTFDDLSPRAPERLWRPDYLAVQGAGGALFEGGCNQSNGSLTFQPSMALSPLEMGLDITVGAHGGASVDCTWESTNEAMEVNLLRATGVLGILASALAGSEVAVRPFGEVAFSSGVDGVLVPGLSGFNAGWSTSDGAYFDLGIPSDTSLINDLEEGLPTVLTAEAGVAGGIQASANLVSANGLIGWLVSFLSDEGADIGLTAEVALGLGAVLQGANAPAVYQDDEESRGAAVTELRASLEASDLLQALADMLGGQGSLVLEVSTEKELFRLAGEYSAGEVNDQGQGTARVDDLVALPSLTEFLGLIPRGRLGPEDMQSSVFNDRHSNISYDIPECEAQPEGKISALIVACAGWFCGETEVIQVCGGDLWIGPLRGSAVVGESATTTGELGVASAATQNSQTITPVVTGSPMEPQESVFSLEPGETETYQATAECGQSAGVSRGVVEASDTPADAFADNVNILTCRCEPGSSDCDRTWASPHLITADGLAYDYYGSGDYILQKIPGVDGIEVQGRFLPGFGVSWPQAVAMRVGSDIVEVHGARFDPPDWPASHLLRVWVNGRPVAPIHAWKSFEKRRYIELPAGGGIYVDQFIGRFSGSLVNPIELTVLWPQGGSTEDYGVKISGLVFDEIDGDAYADTPPMLQFTLLRPDNPLGPERGMLGTNDGNPATDLTRRNGQVIEFSENLTWTELYAMFGGDWLVRPSECLFRNGCIEPEFPMSPVALTPYEQRLAEVACHELRGWYFQACVHDAGLLGSTELVQALYSNTEDLNHMADRIVRPGVDVPVFQLSMGPIDDADGYRLHYEVDLIEGQGEYLLTVRPPRWATAQLENGQTSRLGSTATQGWVDVEHCVADPFWQELDLDWQESGVLQLWTVDPISGGGRTLQDEISIPNALAEGRCLDILESVNSFQHQPASVFVDSNIEEDVRVELVPAAGVDLGEGALGQQQLCAGCSLTIETDYQCSIGLEELAFLEIRSAEGQLREKRRLICRTVGTRQAQHLHAGMWSGFGLAESLLLTDDGTLWNLSRSHGEPIDLTRRMGGYPTPIHPDSFSAPIHHLVSSERHSVVVLEDGEVWSWGFNGQGQVGDGTTTDREAPVRVGEAEFEYPIISMDAGRYHNIALDTAGQVWTWGGNYNGELGDGTEIHRSAPTKIDASAFDAAEIKAVGAGRKFSIALDETGQLWTWGDGGYGQLGNGTSGFYAKSTVPVKVEYNGQQPGSVLQFSAGDRHILMLDDNGDVWSWGSNSSGQLGRVPIGDDMFSNRYPERMDLAFLGQEEFSWVLADNAKEFSVGLDTAGRLWAWGENDDGQLGIGDRETQYSVFPLKVDLSAVHGADVKFVSLGGRYAFMIDSADRVWGWGRNSYQELGDSTSFTKYSPVMIGRMGLEGIDVEIEQLDEPVELPLESASPVTIAVADAVHDLFWPGDFALEISTPDTTFSRNGASSIVIDPFTRTRLGISVRPSDICSDYGQQLVEVEVVHASTEVLAESIVPVRCVPDVAFDLVRTPDETMISARNQTAETVSIELLGLNATTFGGEVATTMSLCSGCDGTATAERICPPFGRLELAQARIVGHQSQLLDEVVLACSEGGREIAVAGAASFAYTTGDIHWGWGSNSNAGLGVGTSGGIYATPQILNRPMLPAGAAKLFSTDARHVQITDSLDRVWGWGDNHRGQLGNNNHYSQFSNGLPGFVSPQPEPVPIEGALSDSPVVALDGGYEWSLGLDANGRVWAWGHNQEHASSLGDATEVDQPLPVPADIPVRAKTLAAGRYFGLALSLDGRGLWSWGGNSEGQLGLGEAWPTYGGYPREDRFLEAFRIDLDFLGEEKTLIDVAAGSDHGLALDSDGRIWAWGQNRSGQLGIGDTDSRFVPTLVDLSPLGGATVMAIAAAGEVSFAQDDQGRIWAWGSNYSGQLGLGSEVELYSVPTEVDLSMLNGMDVTGLAVGARHSLMKDSGGCYWSWGQNNSGQLGNGSTTDQNAPGLVSELSLGCAP